MDYGNCFVCKKHQGTVNIPGGAIYENEIIYVGHIYVEENEQNYLGHIVMDIKRHIKDVDDMSDEEAANVGLVLKHLSRALKACFEIDHVYIHVFGDVVHHLHFHVIPRYKNAPERYWGSNVKFWEGAPRGGTKEVEEVCEILRDYLKDRFEPLRLEKLQV